jgi:hypothetical protein
MALEAPVLKKTLDLGGHPAFFFGFSYRSKSWRLTFSKPSPRDGPSPFKRVACTLPDEQYFVRSTDDSANANYSSTHPSVTFRCLFDGPLWVGPSAPAA